MKTLIILILIISTSLLAEYNSGYQAVAKIELLNGKSFEAIVVIATTPSIGLGYFDQNGFMTVSENDTKYGYLFGGDFYKITFADSLIRSKSGKSLGKVLRRDRYKIVYLRGISFPEKGKKSYSVESKTDSATGKEMYKRTIQVVQEYIMEDSIEVYRYLPEEYELTMGKASYKAQKIAVDDLSSIELIKKPSAKWLESIIQAREKWWVQYEDDACPPAGPLWYHDEFDRYGRLKFPGSFSLHSFEKY